MQVRAAKDLGGMFENITKNLEGGFQKSENCIRGAIARGKGHRHLSKNAIIREEDRWCLYGM